MSGATFAWQVQRFDSLEGLGGRLVAGGARLLLRGRRSTLCSWATFVWLFGRAWRSLGRRWGPAAFAWQAQHFVHLQLLLHGRRNTLLLIQLLLRSTLALWKVLELLWRYSWVVISHT